MVNKELKLFKNGILRSYRMNYIVLLGRILFTAIFIKASVLHFSRATISYAVAHGIPAAGFFIPLLGIIGLAGGLSVLLGYRARYGAWLLILFLLPITFMLHKFCNFHDEASRVVYHSMFLKNLSMIGAALMITYFGSGPFSIENTLDKKEKKKRSRR